MRSTLTLSGRPAKSEHLRVDQDEALIFFFIIIIVIIFIVCFVMVGMYNW